MFEPLSDSDAPKSETSRHVTLLSVVSIFNSFMLFVSLLLAVADTVLVVV